jgi:hypothetical protein
MLAPVPPGLPGDHAGLVEAVGGTLRTAIVALPIDPVGTVGLLDETSSVKQGTKTPGVQRQYLGGVGTVENGLVTVHLAVVHGSFKAVLDGERFLPQSWDADRSRGRQADIPDEVRDRPQWRIGLEWHARARDNGWTFDGLTFDEGDGGKPDFRSPLDTAGQTDVGEIPKSFSCRLGRGPTARSAEAVFARPGVKRRSAKAFRMPPQTGPDAVWQAQAVDARLGDDRRSRHRWIVARNRATGEVKYFRTNAPRRIGLRRVLRAAFVRWTVEHVFRVATSEIGLTHFEGRRYVSLKRHLALCLLALAFVALHTMRLRGEKSGADPGAGVPNACRDRPAIRSPTPRDEGVGMPVGYPELPSGPECHGQEIATETTSTTQTIRCAVMLVGEPNKDRRTFRVRHYPGKRTYSYS